MGLRNKIMGILATVFGMVILSFGLTARGAEIEEENDVDFFEVYKYEVTPDDAEWEQLESVEDKISACRIPENVLANMTEEQLLQAVWDFPFVYDVFSYSSTEEGVKNLENICDAYEELISRKNAKEIMLDEVIKRSNMRKALNTEEEIKNEILAAIILYQEDFQYEFSLAEIEEVAEISTIIDIQTYDENISFSPYAVSIVTPNGTSVLYETRTCSHTNAGFHEEVANETAKAYGITIISNGSCKYNCHSYAWYSQSTSNSYWIN